MLLNQLLLHVYWELDKTLEPTNKSGPETFVFGVFREFGAHQSRGGTVNPAH